MQLNKSMIFDDVLEYKLKKRVMIVMTINHLKKSHFRNMSLRINPKVDKIKKSPIGKNGEIKILKRKRLSLNIGNDSLRKQS